jgi:CRISPR-associated protein Csm2
MAFTDCIKFNGITHELFDSVAMEVAEIISQPKDKNGKFDSKKNKSTQLRKYYDELCMWDQKIKQQPEKYKEFLPLIKMLNAKVAYAKGRDLVDQNFVDLMRHCLGQLTEEKKTFETCKLFFEAFMGFYKMYKPQ